MGALVSRLFKNGFHYNNTKLAALMTEIMEIMISKIAQEPYLHEQSIKLSLFSQIKMFFQQINIGCYQQAQEFVTLLNIAFFCRPQLANLDIEGLLKIQLLNSSIKFKLSFVDSNGCLIKARSQHQKTGLSKFFLTINPNLENECFACHPLTGEIQFRINYFINQSKQIVHALENFLIALANQKSQIQKMLDFLEYSPPIMNQFLANISTKMQKCRSMILGRHHGYKHSVEQEKLEQFFLQPFTEPPIQHSWLQQSRNRVCISQISKKLIIKLILDCNEMKRYNWIAAEFSEESKKHLNSLNNEKKDIQNVEHQVQFKNYPRSVHINFIYKNSRLVADESNFLEKLAKKDNKFYKFIREYINVKKCFERKQADKDYLIYKHEKCSRLKQYLNKNKMILSYQTKLHICFQLASLAYVGLLKIKNFLPSFQPQDLNLHEDHSISVETVISPSKNSPSAEVALTCYQILYGIRCSSNCLKQINSKIMVSKWTHDIKSVNDGELKYQGVSVINYWLKKVLLDTINSSNIGVSPPTKPNYQESVQKAQSCQPKNMQNSSSEQLKQLQKILFVVALAYKSYSEIFKTKIEICSIFDLDF